MACITTRNFASTAATGADWRAVARRIADDLIPHLAPRDDPYNLGFLYISDHLAADAASILDLLRELTGIAHWVGAVGLGVCAMGRDHVDIPAASVLVGTFPEDMFQVFPVSDPTLAPARETLGPWLERNESMLVLVHGDPVAEHDPAHTLGALGHLTGGFIAGGLSASRTNHVVIADDPGAGGVGGVVFSADIPVASALSQGCVPIGPAHIMTAAEGQVIRELDGRPAFDVFTDDLRAMARAASGDAAIADDIRDVIVGDSPGALHDDVTRLFRGEIHLAFPVPGSDRTDYMVRNIAGVDPDTGWLAATQAVHPGDSVMFVHRDDDTVRNDLVQTVMRLRERIVRDHGAFAPQAGVYISCVARIMTDFSGGDAAAMGGEMALIHSLLGDIPLAGFYANGEIANQRLYGYTGVLILFL